MKENKKEEIQSRREFFKSVAKKALPILGAIALTQLPFVAKSHEKIPSSGCEGCSGACKGGCKYGCGTSCYVGCEGHTRHSGCKGTCNVLCQITCQGECSGTCSGSCLNTSKSY